MFCSYPLKRILAGTLCFVNLEASVVYAETTYSFIAHYNNELNTSSASIQHEAVVTSLGRKKRIFLTPEFGLRRRDIFIQTANWELAGISTVAMQYGYLGYPDGFSHSSQTRTVTFAERTKVNKTKAIIDLGLRLYTKSVKNVQPFAGLGVKYSYANISYNFGEWKLKDTVEKLSKEASIGVVIPIINSGSDYQVECEVGFSEVHIRKGCGLNFQF